MGNSFSVKVASSSLRNYFVPESTRECYPLFMGDIVSGIGSRGILGLMLIYTILVAAETVYGWKRVLLGEDRL